MFKKKEKKKKKISCFLNVITMQRKALFFAQQYYNQLKAPTKVR